MSTELERLAKLAKRWGGAIYEIPECDFDEYRTDAWSRPYAKRAFYDAPFTSARLGVFWRKKHIVYVGEAKWADVIHEMGHVFATKEDPNNADEYQFFGWEYAVAKHIGGDLEVWKKSHADYAIGTEDINKVTQRERRPSWDTEDFGCLSPDEQELLLTARIAHARKIGLIRGRYPQAIR